MHQVNVDLSYLNTIAGGDTAFVKELLGMFLTTAQEEIDNIERHYQDGTLSDMSSAAHKIKAPIQMLAENTLADLVIRIEYIGKHKENEEELPELINQLKQHLSKVLIEVEKVMNNL